MKKKEHKPSPPGWQMPLGRPNFILMAAAVALIVAGYLLMLPPVDIRNTPGGRYAAAPGPGAFEPIRIKVAPVPCFLGFALMIPAIMLPKRVKSGRMKSEK